MFGLCLNPPDRALVLCVDESEPASATGPSKQANQIQALDRTQPGLPLRPGQAERFFALLTELQIKRGAHRSTAELEAAITTSIDTHNANPKPFRCTKSADEPKATPERWYILAAIQRVCQRTLAVQAQCG